MVISATAKFLVRNIVLGNITYLEAVEKKPDLKEQIDDYIEREKLDIDRTK